MAKELCRKGISIQHNIFDLHYALSIAYFSEGNYEQAIKELNYSSRISNKNSIETEIALKITRKKNNLKIKISGLDSLIRFEFLNIRNKNFF